ncbi:MAG: Flp pilus assembly protein RcpC/CpaB [Clostridia bacterium]|nr:Flp pilus assembly protein RcpC/CpaB [Clostridia bacterium]
MQNRYVRLAISLAAALVLTYLIISMGSSEKVQYRTVMVAARDIEPNTALGEDNLSPQKLPAHLVPEGALGSVPAGKLAGQKIWKGELLLQPMVRDNPVNLPVPENRIFAIPVNLKTASGLRPGDRVDVLLFTGKQSGGGEKGLSSDGESRLILAGVEVVRVLNQSGAVLNEAKGAASGSAAVPAVAEVLVTVSQANLLNVAANIGTLALARYLPASQPVAGVPVATLAH